MDQGRRLRPVEKIAGQRVADMRHMHPDLMGAPGLRHELYETAAVKACNEIVVRDRRLSVRSDFPRQYGAVFSTDRGVDPSAERGGETLSLIHI